MSLQQAQSTYRRMIDAYGETVTLRRESLDPAPEATARARVVGLTPEELASGIDQGSRKMILLAEDVEAAIATGGWPAPPAGYAAIQKNDVIVVRGAPLNVESVDDNTRRVGGVLVAYEIVAIG